jgi:hypothetical protein
LFCLMAATLYSCKKSNDNSTPADSQISLLTNGTWKISKLEYQTSGGSWVTVAIPSAQANETISFNKDNTYFSYAGSIANGSWKFSADYSQIFLVNQSNAVSGTLTVNALTQSTLQIQQAGTQVVNGTTYSAERDTFTH